MLKGEKQKFGMEKRVKLPVDHNDLQGVAQRKGLNDVGGQDIEEH